MNHWLLFVAITLTVTLAVTGGLARWLGRMGRADWPTDEYEAELFGNECAACRRSMPEDALVRDAPDRDEMWCADWDECKSYRAMRVAEGVDS